MYSLVNWSCSHQHLKNQQHKAWLHDCNLSKFMLCKCTLVCVYHKLLPNYVSATPKVTYLNVHE